MNNKTILAIIALGIVVIAGTLIYQAQQKTPAEQVADSIGNAAEDIGNAARGN